MKISSKAHYGLQAAFLLAKANGVLSTKELENEIGVSSKYLERIMRALSVAGIIKANRGTSGGYYLAKGASETTAGEVVRALEDELEIITCVKSGSCNKCGTSFVWKKLYNGINEVLDSITLQSMVENDRANSLALSACSKCSSNGSESCSCNK